MNKKIKMMKDKTKRYLIIASAVINVMYAAATIAAPYAWEYVRSHDVHIVATSARQQIAMATAAIDDENALKPPETTLDSMPTKKPRRK